MQKDKRIILFARFPEPGKTKTRLIPALGPAGAADLHARMAEQTLVKIRRFAKQHSAGFEICFAGGSKEKILGWLGKDVSPSPQSFGDLGLRMSTAFRRAFNQGAKQVVLVGTDIPELTEGCFEKAFDALASHDVVLGPSTDGGYWLVGMKQNLNIFSGISWGSPEVLSQTLKGFEGRLSSHLLSPLRDVDTLEDLASILPHEVSRRPYVSVIIPALNEEQNLQNAIRSAEDEAAEILVVDGGSTDATVGRALGTGARVLKTGRGRALQQNSGAKEAKGKVLLFLHADTLLPEGYVNHVFDLLLNKKVILGAFRFKTTLHTPLMRFFEKAVHVRSTIFQMPYGDQGLFLKKKTFQTLGGFPDTPIAEDLLLVRRAVKLGRVAIAPAAALTSGRRWEKKGIFRTFLINQMVVMGLAMGVSPGKLASLYHHKAGNFFPTDETRG
ncbi:MAG: TIGR04283 family arsenosugar biosynthesis glycosyltransferase [Proteobacteria bacterium]|nr:TIGR04283 family arsenosugar biosynthesis glycosyltransferase [Pseudomonadota bacterium]MBU4053424.1 TIGR04283 family arsenosugar biosynthesis glycosyltransferase [Pseudomonadota bacterium]